MNRLAKLLLIATSLSPLLGAIGIGKWAKREGGHGWWILSALLLAFVCRGLLAVLSVRLSKNSFTPQEFQSQDKEVLVFLLTYLLPFISSDKLAFTDEWLVGVYIVGIVLLSLIHADAFHFNPVMSLFGYHFYSVKGTDGLPYLLIATDQIRRPGHAMSTVALAHNIKLQIET